MWISALPEDQLNMYPEYRMELLNFEKFPYKDRRQELVIITIRKNQQEIEDLLDTALLTDAEMEAGVEVWKTYPDNFPTWNLH